MSGIIRIEKNKNYTHISNVPANDSTLSWEARGVLYYLLTKPDGWECRNQDLINKGPAGSDKINRILDELKENGYISRRRVTKNDGTFDWITTIYEMPIQPEQAVKDRIAKKREAAKKKQQERKLKATIGVLSTDGSPTDGKHPHIVNTDLVNTKETITKTETITDNGDGDIDPIFGKVCTVYENEIGILSPKISSLIKELLLDYPPDWIIEAIGIAVKANARKLSYVNGILQRWKTDGRQPIKKTINGKVVHKIV